MNTDQITRLLRETSLPPEQRLVSIHDTLRSHCPLGLRILDVDVQVASAVAYERNLWAVEGNHPNTEGLKREVSNMAIDFHGALAELAVSRLIDRTWNFCDDPSTVVGDVGHDLKLDVKHSTKHRNLLIGQSDFWKNDYLFVHCLVDYDKRQTFCCGAIMGADAKRDEWLHTDDTGRPPCYIVPAGSLTKEG